MNTIIAIKGVGSVGKTETIQPRNKSKRKKSLAHMSQSEIEILHSFTSILGIKRIPFGQSGKAVFGISDGNKGVQWNLAIYSDTGNIKLGVNLEGSQATGKWKIVDFILNELKNPSLELLKHEVDDRVLKDITVSFCRDAWRGGKAPPSGGTRVSIIEQYLGGKEFSLFEINTELWSSILKEGLECLNKNKEYKGRAIQEVTEVLKNGNKKPNLRLGVSPHLTIQTKIENYGNITDNLQKGFDKLKPIYNWVNERCGTKNF